MTVAAQAHWYTWSDPETAAAYARFCEHQNRYHAANRNLVGHARLTPQARVLDYAAGIGLTAEAVFRRCAGSVDEIACVEPSEAMRAVGVRRVPGAKWCEAAEGSFDRVLCGAAVWALEDFDGWLRSMRAMVRPGGALAFNAPAQYLGVAGEAGGGSDPWLVQLPARIAQCGAAVQPAASSGGAGWGLASTSDVEAALDAAGMRWERWGFRYRLTQSEYAEWLRIPVLTNGMLPQYTAGERSVMIDDACRLVDANSWRWEPWVGWTAWV